MTTSLFLFWTMHHQLVYMATKSNNTIFLDKLEPLVNITQNANTSPGSQASVGQGRQAGLCQEEQAKDGPTAWYSDIRRQKLSKVSF